MARDVARDPQPPLTVLEILKRSTKWLEGRGLESPRLDVELVMAHALGIQRLDLYLQFDRPLAEAELAPIRALVRRRGAREPVAYLLGEREFHSLPFFVDEHVLVPRPETELLVEVAHAHLAGLEAPVFCDVGTGSGCIAVTLLHELAGATGLATDVSAEALAVARRNAERHGVLSRLDLLEGDLLEPVRVKDAWGRLDAVVSNPPYILEDDAEVEEGVRLHEPRAALFVPGDDPLQLARRIAEQAREALAPGGLIAMEVGHTSGQSARSMLADMGYVAVEVRPDLAGIERVVLGRRPA